MSNNDSAPWYCEDAPLAPFSIYLLLSNPSLEIDKARACILGSWTLSSLHVDGYKQLAISGSEHIIIDLKHIRAKREGEDIPLEARKLLIPYSVIDKNSLALKEKKESYVLMKVIRLSKTSLAMEYTDVSKEGSLARIKKHWTRS